ncbi:MAG TPA: pyridoxal phosphate-dependent aminotransferase family protein [candidate division Zixibacteria bacterium]|nr:pyridoxal phosphate-dependent aminotransferase family protein [candidate division Zixibacteria bacterium]HEQ97774.1 pyridoxal phosphate-dependent aminotransferase family protein [candidate division Zixibacteria bacterium]
MQGSEQVKIRDIFDKCREFTRATEVKQAGYYPYFNPISSAAANTVMIDGKELIMIGSNNYLGLTTHPKVIEASREAVKKYGVGCTGSRFLNGTLDIHLELEEELAKFLRKEAVLVFSTGFQTNLGTISCLVNKNDLILADRSDHASIVDGCRLAFGKTLKYKHNDIEDLERILVSRNNGDQGILLVVDGVFSMEGDIVNLPQLVKLRERFGFRLMVDDAHSLGVLGEDGSGTATHFGLNDQVDLIMGTFSKSFASIGGVIAADAYVINYIKHFSRPLIFSAALPPSAVAAVLECLKIIKAEPERREKLLLNGKKMRDGLRAMGYSIGTTETPIVPVYIGEDMACFKFWRTLYDAGIFANAIIAPAVNPGNALIRTSYTATHTDEQLDFVLETFEKVGKKLGLI